MLPALKPKPTYQSIRRCAYFYSRTRVHPALVEHLGLECAAVFLGLIWSDRENSLRTLAHQTGLSFDIVRRRVAQLQKRGVLQKKRNGPLKSEYDLNVERVYAELESIAPVFEYGAVLQQENRYLSGPLAFSELASPRALPPEMVRTLGLRATVLLLAVVALHAEYPTSHADLAAYCCLARGSVPRALATLLNAGLVSVVSSDGQTTRYGVNRYRIHKLLVQNA